MAIHANSTRTPARPLLGSARAAPGRLLPARQSGSDTRATVARQSDKAEPLRKFLDVDSAATEIASYERWYALRVDGDCMAPILHTGDVAVFDAEAWPKVGDLAVVYLRGTKDGVPGVYPWVKRITMSMWPMKLPHRPHPDSNVVPLLSFESNVPGQAWTVQATVLYGLHKFIGKKDDLVWDGALWVPKTKARRRAARPKDQAA